MAAIPGFEIFVLQFVLTAKDYPFNKASEPEANILISFEMEIFNFLWLIWEHNLPLTPPLNDRPRPLNPVKVRKI
jgi:hypothetical protein